MTVTYPVEDRNYDTDFDLHAPLTTKQISDIACGANGLFSIVETDDAVFLGTVRNHPETLHVTVENGGRGRPNIIEYADVLDIYAPGSGVDTISDAPAWV